MSDSPSRSPRVLAIWLDGADSILVESMMAAGELPTLRAMREEGGFGRIRNIDLAYVEATASMVLTGRPPEETGYGNIQQFCPRTYELSGTAACDSEQTVPFYALGDKLRVTAFDMPFAGVYPGVNGTQVANWGANSHDMPPGSIPAGLSEEIVERYGEHPARGGIGYAMLEDPESIRGLHERLKEGLQKRELVTLDLLRRSDWDLFVTTFNETDPAGHYLLPHRCCREAFAACEGEGFMRSIYREVDAALGRIFDSVGSDTRIVVFSAEGMRENSDDLPSQVFLPELLFRYSFPGQQAMEFDPEKLEPSPESLAGIHDWVMEMWNHRVRTSPRATRLRERFRPLTAARLEGWLGISPTLFHPLTDDQFLNHQPLRWYRPYWPRMKAFALPTSSQGLIRLNVRGREKRGIVRAKDYDSVCDELTRHLKELTLPETGKKAVTGVSRLRKNPFEAEGEHQQIADLVVEWDPETGDRIQSPTFGLLGPVPMVRTGTHTREGFLFAKGPGIAAGSVFEDKSVLDIADTVLGLAGVEG